MRRVIPFLLYATVGCTGTIGGDGADGADGADSDDADSVGDAGDADSGDRGEPPADEADCHAWLDYYEVGYELGPDAMGVEDPVTATMPIVGIGYRTVGANAAREEMFGDCTIIRSLARAAPVFAAAGVTEVTDYGVYSYRCIGGGAPPCTRGISQHASATAIDLAGFTDAADTFYSVEDDWVIDPNAEETCEAPSEAGKDRFLHELICALDAADVWNIILTPNYNADHRDHFHVDLTPGANLTERSMGPSRRPHHH